MDEHTCEKLKIQTTELLAAGERIHSIAIAGYSLLAAVQRARASNPEKNAVWLEHETALGELLKDLLEEERLDVFRRGTTKT